LDQHPPLVGERYELHPHAGPLPYRISVTVVILENNQLTIERRTILHAYSEPVVDLVTQFSETLPLIEPAFSLRL
jgi:hypothetical protein